MKALVASLGTEVQVLLESFLETPLTDASMVGVTTDLGNHFWVRDVPPAVLQV